MSLLLCVSLDTAVLVVLAVIVAVHDLVIAAGVAGTGDSGCRCWCGCCAVVFVLRATFDGFCLCPCGCC